MNDYDMRHETCFFLVYTRVLIVNRQWWTNTKLAHGSLRPENVAVCLIVLIKLVP